MKASSFARVRNLCRLYWHTSRRTLMRLYLGLTAFYLVKTPLLYILNRVMIVEFEGFSRLMYTYNHFISWVFGLVCLSYLFAFLHRRTAATAILCLPATNAEKFLTRVVLGTLAIVCVFKLAELSSGVVHVAVIAALDMLAGNGYSPDAANYYLATVFWPFNLLSRGFALTKVLSEYAILLMVASWLTSVFTFSGILFRRHGWALSFVFIAALWLMAYFAIRAFGIPETKTFDACVIALCLLFALLNYYFAYRAFCRAQIH